jgi:hypothetical protein
LRIRYLIVSVLTFWFMAVGQAQAELISLVGDKDGFGVPGAPPVPPNGTLFRDGLGGVFFRDYRDAFDLATAPFTDIWDAPMSVSYRHTYSLGGEMPLGAILDIQIAGIGDFGTPPYNLLYNGTVIGAIPDRRGIPNAFQEVLLYSFTVPVDLLTGSDAVFFGGTGGDGFIVNFSELRITTEGDVIPEPAALVLLGFGSLGLVGYGWRRRR